MDFDLERFVAAQDAGGSYEGALQELRRGRKTSHWIWWVFPQISGLGLSPTSRRYAISSSEEARAYLGHPVLGPRLREASLTLVDAPGDNVVAILGAIDAVKVRSSMTLFAITDPAQAVYQQVLDRFYGGQLDPLTQQLVGSGS